MMNAKKLYTYATAWSLREYPSQEGEWSWAQKFHAIREAGFTGIMSPPREELSDASWIIGRWVAWGWKMITQLTFPK